MQIKTILMSSALLLFLGCGTDGPGGQPASDLQPAALENADVTPDLSENSVSIEDGELLFKLNLNGKTQNKSVNQGKVQASGKKVVRKKSRMNALRDNVREMEIRIFRNDTGQCQSNAPDAGYTCPQSSLVLFNNFPRKADGSLEGKVVGLAQGEYVINLKLIGGVSNWDLFWADTSVNVIPGRTQTVPFNLEISKKRIPYNLEFTGVPVSIPSDFSEGDFYECKVAVGNSDFTANSCYFETDTAGSAAVVMRVTTLSTGLLVDTTDAFTVKITSTSSSTTYYFSTGFDLDSILSSGSLKAAYSPDGETSTIFSVQL